MLAQKSHADKNPDAEVRIEGQTKSACVHRQLVKEQDDAEGGGSQADCLRPAASIEDSGTGQNSSFNGPSRCECPHLEIEREGRCQKGQRHKKQRPLCRLVLRASQADQKHENEINAADGCTAARHCCSERRIKNPGEKIDTNQAVDRCDPHLFRVSEGFPKQTVGQRHQQVQQEEYAQPADSSKQVRVQGSMKHSRRHVKLFKPGRVEQISSDECGNRNSPPIPQKCTAHGTQAENEHIGKERIGQVLSGGKQNRSQIAAEKRQECNQNFIKNNGIGHRGSGDDCGQRVGRSGSD